jgi:hypothetical protein
MEEEVIEDLISKLIIEAYPKKPTGGQNVGTFIPGVKISCPETGFEMVCTYHRSRMRNRDIIMALYKEFLKIVSENKI